MGNAARDHRGMCKTCGAMPNEVHTESCLFHPKEFRCSPCTCGGHEDCTICNPSSVLDEARRLVHGDRQDAYGHPRDNHSCTASMWTAYLRRRDSVTAYTDLDAFDVCMLNILQKVSRLAHTRHRDGLVDIAGFAANAEMVDEVG